MRRSHPLPSLSGHIGNGAAILPVHVLLPNVAHKKKRVLTPYDHIPVDLQFSL